MGAGWVRGGVMRIIGVTMLALAAGLSVGVAPAAAQSPGLRVPTDISAQRTRRVRPSIRVVPGDRLYRQCVDWYQLERRPSGAVITPQMRCTWAIH
jgi:hypothetical protein